MSTNEMVPVVSSVSQIQSVLDLAAIIIGVVSIYSLVRLNKKLGGKLSGAIKFFNLGMTANVLAIISSVLWVHEYTLSGVTFDLHHVLMSIGMIFFILSTRKLSGLVQN